ncbi:immunity 52 family protein [Corallococcus sp. bb12-1]|uniref:immunity 52 family protein n=1 Tax=Corallococcus sp. bb12-1 TaxID=2996784 RepID=UPI002270EEF1|nr:immunity 52 family protein [Corallococcus sp. bb12-1]MCY1045069.1 immunity 52 family protein [Corallococcus sp. bb12-1]
MTETIYAGSYWGARKESAEACALRMERLFANLASVDSSFAQWFQQGRSRKAALLRPIEPGGSALEALIRRGRDRVFEDLGFRVRGWNGVTDDHDASGLDVTCGGYTQAVNNFCVFSLPTQGPHAERVLTAPILCGLVRSMATAWEPEWAIATSTAHRNRVTDNPKPGTFVGWIMYLARSRGPVPPLPAPVRIEPVEDKGTLIILTPERFTVSNPEHVALAEHVRGLLDTAGLMKPLTP